LRSLKILCVHFLFSMICQIRIFFSCHTRRHFFCVILFVFLPLGTCVRTHILFRWGRLLQASIFSFLFSSGLCLLSPLIYMYICFRVWCHRSDFLSPCLSSFCFFSSLGEPFSPSLIRIKSAGQILPSHSLSSTRCHPLSPLIDIFSLGKTNFFIRFSSSWSHCFLLYCDHFRKSQS
jgi:hypothetical protein